MTSLKPNYLPKPNLQIPSHWGYINLGEKQTFCPKLWVNISFSKQYLVQLYLTNDCLVFEYSLQNPHFTVLTNTKLFYHKPSPIPIRPDIKRPTLNQTPGTLWIIPALTSLFSDTAKISSSYLPPEGISSHQYNQ